MANLDQALETGMIAIIRSKSEAEGRELSTALVAAGIIGIEFTTTTPGVFNLISEFSANSQLAVGVGTAMNEADVQNAKAAGAQYVLSPHTSADVIRATKAANLISIPGVATPTDVANALAFGADLLKLFPGSSLGSIHLKALRDPFPNQKWLVTGGVSIASLGDWFAAGATGFGLGGPLTAGGVGEVLKRTNEFRNAIKLARGA